MSRQPPHQRLEGVLDLSGLSGVSDDVIVACIRERFMADNIYTRIGTSALVVLNPHKYVSSSADNVLQKYAAEYRNTTSAKEILPPHIFQLANNVYYHMKRTTQDQSIILSGESASGKSESRRLAIKSIIELSVSSPGKKGAKLATQVPAAEFVLESFGNARTLFNPNASRFGKYTELQFSDRGRLTGLKTLDYYLERNRVAGAPSGERNFHIFYYLAAGATPEERQHLHLDDKTTYRYLGQRNTAVRPNGAQNDDILRFDQLKVALKTIGFSKRHVAQTCQLLAAILHLGNLDFIIDRGRNEDAAVVRNTEVCATVADFLGVHPGELEQSLSYRSKMVKKEMCTIFLDPDGASDNRDDLAKALYSLLFSWLNEHINQRLCRDDFSTFIGLFDLPGPQNMTSRANSLDQFCINFANERLHHWTQKRLFEAHVNEYNAEGISHFVPSTAYSDNTECIRLLQNKPGGLIHIMDDQACRQPKKTNHTMVEAFQKRWGNHSSFKSGTIDRSGFPTFTVDHFNGPVTYSTENFIERNQDELNSDFVNLLRGVEGMDGTGSINPFVKGLFSAKQIATKAHPRNEDTIVAAQQNVKPMRAPSTRRKGTIKRMATVKEGVDGDDDEAGNTSVFAGGSANPGSCVAGEFRIALDTLFETLEDTQSWHVFCINPNDSQLPNQLEGRSVRGQVRSMNLTEIAKRSVNVFEVSMTPEEFCDRYKESLEEVGVVGEDERDRVEHAKSALGLNENDIVMGQQKVFLSQTAFHLLEDKLRSQDVEEQKRDRLRDAEAAAGLAVSDAYAPYVYPLAEDETPWSAGHSDKLNSLTQNLPLVESATPFRRADLYDEEFGDDRSFHSEDFDARSRLTSQRDESLSQHGSESYAPSRNMFQNADKAVLVNKEPLAGEILEGETSEVIKESSARRKWVFLCWALTWWIPSPCLKWIGRMKRPDVRQAWREKLALNLLIWFCCGISIFIIAVLGLVICPAEHVFSQGELSSHDSTAAEVYTSIRGEVFDLAIVSANHQRIVSVVPTKSILQYGGTSADDIFPVQISALCNGITGTVSPFVALTTTNTSDPNAVYHDFLLDTNDYRPDWYFESMVTMRYTARVGFLGYTPAEIKDQASSGKSVGIYDGLVYDVSPYISTPPSINPPPDSSAPSGIVTEFMDPSVIDVFKFNNGGDITKSLNALVPNTISAEVLQRQKVCLRNLFLIGKVDNRSSPQCLFAKYILLALSIVMVSVIGFKFLASINFNAARAPEDHDKFVICQVPCYTEGEASLRRTIDSLAQMRYDDKRKLLVVICDGMIVGSGNDRPTPRIVLDILGADPNLDPEPLSFLSIGEGAKQHNMGKIYSGLYEQRGHVVPYLVIVKVGKPNERSRPGNRGKRDSQLILMHFLNKVHFNTPMNPMELEMYHQIKNVIGVNPTFYEYLFTVDADTVVDEYSINRLVSAMIHDKKLLACCGETELSNAKQSLITMMQVYEYFISHHMVKAFESLFGSVSCLPGCFSLYRLRTPDTHKPLFIANQIVHNYSENRVDTLHMKNLLHLGEDRYLTTLLMKHFPMLKTQFVRDAHAFTVAPDDWKVLLSQRRRWINSTVHNLGELIFLEQLCGFCCFSMRFVVMIDLVSTIIQPVTVGYIVYLIYSVVSNGETIPTISLIMLGAIYGLQALVFIMRRKWDMIGWMVFYILAIPIFSLILPLYSFWRMDDFSWGATRLVMGESGKKLVIHDEGKFDPKAIPLKSWNDYENELWDKESNHSIGSWVPPQKFQNEGYPESQTASLYGRETYYDPQRTQSPVPSQQMMYLPSGHHSVRNTSQSDLRMPKEKGMMYPPSQRSQSIYQPTPSRPTTMYQDMPMTGSPDNASLSGSPSDSDIERVVQNIIRVADLNSVTKREIRRQLEEHFGMDLVSRRAVINAAIDRCLAEQAS